MASPLFKVGRFVVHDAAEMLSAEHPMIEHLLGGNGALPTRPELTFFTDILEKTEKATGLRFHHELLVAREGVPIPLGVSRDGRIFIGADFLRTMKNNPELLKCGLLHEAAHFRHNDMETTERFTRFWSNVGRAHTATELFGRDAIGFTAAVKAIYGSAESFSHEAATIGKQIEHAMGVFPDFSALGKLEPMQLLNKFTTEPDILQRIQQLPLPDAESKLFGVNHARLYLQAPGFREFEIERLGKLGISESEVRQYISMMKEAYAAGGAETAISRHGVTENEINTIRQALAPLKPYSSRYDEVRQFAQTQSQAMEHRADLHAAYYGGSPEGYNAMLKNLHEAFGEARPAIFADGAQLHPNDAERRKVTLQMMDKATPARRIQAAMGTHQGTSEPKTHLMRLLAEDWEKSSTMQI